MTDRQRPSPAELQLMYRKVGTVPAVSAALGVAYETARQWLLDAGVELRAKGRPSTNAETLDQNELVSRYGAGESIATIGKAYKVSPTTVRKRLLDAGVTLRPRPGWPA